MTTSTGPIDLTGKFVASRRRPPTHWMDLTPAHRVESVSELGLPAFRAKQISTQWFSRLDTDPAGWTDLPAAVRQQVADKFFPTLLVPIREQSADAGLTIKTAWRAFDGAVIESVIMRYPGRTTICISSEAGCGMACPFCATDISYPHGAIMSVALAISSLESSTSNSFTPAASFNN